MNDSAGVSVLIVTYRRNHWLNRCVKSLLSARMKDQALQIVIVVNGPDPESREAASNLHSEFPQFVAEPLRFDLPESPPQARNRALSALVHPWVLFIDDDAFVEDDFFARFSEAAFRFSKAAAIGGPNLTPRGSTLFQQAAGDALSTRLGSFSSHTRYRPTGPARKGTDLDIILCNLFVRRKVLHDEPFPRDFRCAEENWLIQSLLLEGHEVIYEPLLQVSHERRGSIPQFVSQVHKYGYGRGQNMVRRSSTLRISHLVPSAAVCLGATLLFESVVSGHLNSMLEVLTGLYAGLLLCSVFTGVGSLKRRALRTLVYPMIHIAYGMGVLAGISGDILLLALHSRRCT